MAYGDSPAASLAAVRAAIAAILSGNQEYRIGDRKFTKAKIDDLYTLERYWEGKTGIAGNTNPKASTANFEDLYA